MKIIALCLVCLVALLLPLGCGSGSGGPAGPVTRTAVVKITGVPQRPLYGAQFTVTLPSAVALPRAADGTLAEAAVSSLAGAGPQLVAHYDQAATPQALRVSLVSGTPIPLGELVAITCSVAAGKEQSLADISVPAAGFQAFDESGAEIGGVSPSVVIR